MKSRVFKRFVSLLLGLVFSTQLVTAALAAVIQNDDGSLILTDENGNVIEEDWEAEFPYGTFVFENSQLATAEDAGEKSIKIFIGFYAVFDNINLFGLNTFRTTANVSIFKILSG